VRRRFDGQCGYCGVHEEDIGARLTIDHYQPRSQNGSHDLENLVYCCHACNEFKGEFWSEETEQRPLHALYDKRESHYVERVDHVLVALTPRGEIHINLLQLNRPERIAMRQRRHERLQENNRFNTIHHRLDTIEAAVRHLSEQIVRVTGGITVEEDR
jgi:hypothetical protein